MGMRGGEVLIGLRVPRGGRQVRNEMTAIVNRNAGRGSVSDGDGEFGRE
jgi:hypothetical protein